MNTTKTQTTMELVGKTIAEVRDITDDEAEDVFGWPSGHGIEAVVVLDDGTRLIASADPEGNQPGVLFIEPGDEAKETHNLAAEMLDMLQYPVDAAAVEYVVRTLNDNPKMKLWPGERYEAPGSETIDYKSPDHPAQFHAVYDNLITDTDVRMHMVGDTGVQNFYHVLEFVARLLVAAGRGDRVLVEPQCPADDTIESSNGVTIVVSPIKDEAEYQKFLDLAAQHQDNPLFRNLPAWADLVAQGKVEEGGVVTLGYPDRTEVVAPSVYASMNTTKLATAVRS
jgi:hypothetical protein